MTLREAQERALPVWEAVFKLVQVVVIPLLVLIWQEQKETRKAQIEQLAAIIRLQTQMETTLKVDAKLAVIEAWKHEHEGQTQLLIQEFRELQQKVR